MWRFLVCSYKTQRKAEFLFKSLWGDNAFVLITSYDVAIHLQSFIMAYWIQYCIIVCIVCMYLNTVYMAHALNLAFWLGLLTDCGHICLPTAIISNYPHPLWVWPVLEDTLEVFSPCFSADYLWWNPSRRVLRQGEISPSERVGVISLPADVAGRTPCLFELGRKGDAW